MSAQPHRSDVEALLSRALAPVEPPEHLSVRLEDTLTTITALAADELEAWELRTLHDPRTWVRPAVAVGIGTVAAGGLARPAGAPRPRAPAHRRRRPGRVRGRRGAHDRGRGRAAPARMSTQTETTCYRHPGPRDARLVLELRAPDLPGLHAPEPGRHALPGVRDADDEGQDRCASVGGEPRATIALIVICVDRLPRRGQLRRQRRQRRAVPRRRAVRPGGRRRRLVAPGHLRLPARRAAAHRLQHAAAVAVRPRDGAAARHADLPGHLLLVAAGRRVRRAGVLARRADRRRLRARSSA